MTPHYLWEVYKGLLNYAIDSWKDDALLLSSGLIFLINKDSEITRSSLFECKDSIEKSWLVKT